MLLRFTLIVGLLVAGSVPTWAQIQTQAQADAHAAAREEIQAKEVEAWAKSRQEKAYDEARRQQAENSTYEYRDPTPAEVAAKEEDWKAKNPFKFSGTMPDFSKQKIRVQKARAESPTDSDRIKELTDRLAALEQKAAQTQATPKPATHASSGRVNNPPTAQIKSEPTVQSPSKPNPANMVLRKKADGKYVALIGGKTMTFASEQEAQAYLAKLKP